MSEIFATYAQFYDLLYRDKDYHGEAAYVAGILKRQGVGAGVILELGSGTGRHAQELARIGFDIRGIDASDKMVDLAISGLPPELAGKLRFEIGDARTFRCEKRFDAVISLFHVASYQTTNEDLVAVFETAAHHLEQGGTFVFDCWFGPAVLTRGPSVRVKRIAGDDIKIIRIAEPSLDVTKNLVSVDYTVMIHSTGMEGEIQTLREIHRMRYYFEPEVRYMLRQAGLEVRDAHEWATCKPLTSDTWSATFVARKV